MFSWNKILQPGYGKQTLLHLIQSTHRIPSTIMNMISITSDLQISFTRARISTAC
jgi:hypothetical protein